jgi:antitoxin HicB
MTMYAYPVILAPDDNGTVLVSFPDIPFAHTFGDDANDAMRRAADALEAAFVTIIGDRDEVPAPSKAKRGQKTVALPALAALKVALYEAMRESGTRKADLARLLGWHLPQVDRLLDLRHASRMDQIEVALNALGRRLVVSVEPMAA